MLVGRKPFALRRLGLPGGVEVALDDGQEQQAVAVACDLQIVLILLLPSKRESDQHLDLLRQLYFRQMHMLSCVSVLMHTLTRLANLPDVGPVTSSPNIRRTAYIQ